MKVCKNVFEFDWIMYFATVLIASGVAAQCLRTLLAMLLCSEWLNGSMAVVNIIT